MTSFAKAVSRATGVIVVFFSNHYYREPKGHRHRPRHGLPVTRTPTARDFSYDSDIIDPCPLAEIEQCTSTFSLSEEYETSCTGNIRGIRYPCPTAEIEQCTSTFSLSEEEECGTTYERAT